MKQIPLERHVLSSMVLFPELIPSGCMQEHFTDTFNQTFFEALIRLARHGHEDLSHAMVAAEGNLDPHFAIDQLMPCYVPSTAWARQLIEQLHDRCKFRKVFAEYRLAFKQAREADSPMAKFRGLQALIDSTADKAAKTGLVSARELITEGLDDQEQILAGNPSPNYLTGFSNLDRKLGGVRPGELVVLAAEPGAGKTTWLYNLVSNLAASYGPCLFFSAEMSGTQLREKWARTEMCVGPLANPKPDDISRARLSVEHAKYLDNILVDLRSIVTMGDVLSVAQAVRAEKNLICIAFDHLRHWDPGSASENDYQRLSKAIAQVKLTAKETGSVVVLATHLSRSRSRATTPTMDMLRGSGQIEEDADVVLCLWPRKDESGVRLSTDLFILKSRMVGGTCSFPLSFDPSTQRYSGEF